jgi:hypothetical protein
MHKMLCGPRFRPCQRGFFLSEVKQCDLHGCRERHGFHKPDDVDDEDTIVSGSITEMAVVMMANSGFGSSVT